MNIKSLLINSLLFFPMLAQAVSTNALQESFLHELESANYALTLNYAPTEWKHEYLNWDAETAMEDAKAALIANPAPSMRDYQRIYRDFLGSLQDYHVRSFFYSTEWSTFPIQVKSVGKRYFITDLQFRLSLSFIESVFDIEDLPFEDLEKEFFKLTVGDEILSIDGLPIREVIESLIDSELSGNRTATGYALAERMLFTRMGKYGHDVPKGVFNVTVRSHDRKDPFACNLAWLHAPEWVKDPQPKSVKGLPQSKMAKVEQLLIKDFSVEIAKDFIKFPLTLQMDTNDEKSDWREKGFLPELGLIVWETSIESDIYAYIYKNQKGEKIGYLYIPDFDKKETLADKMIEELSEVIKRFQSETVALVVDINDNPGGNAFYMYAILSLLTEKPLVAPTQMETLIQGDVYTRAFLYKYLQFILEDEEVDLSNLGTLDGYPICESDIHSIIDYTKSILDQWDLGITRTSPAPLFGLTHIKPHSTVQYTKPILVLTNELDFSCGDLFPAILQDNGRATLFGKTTAGAGGSVIKYAQESKFAVAMYSLTGSLAYRVDGKVIENLGVTPDVPYEITQRDLKKNYVDYIRTLNQQLRLMVK